MATLATKRAPSPPADATRHSVPPGVVHTADIPLALLVPSPYNPRKHFDDDALRQLADSLLQHGMLQPLVVRPLGDGRFEIVAGERRYRAAVLANLERVPVRARPLTDRGALELAIIENLQRQDLDPIEQAEGYRALADVGMKQGEIALAVKCTQPTIAKSLGLLKLPPEVQELIRNGTLSQGHGHILEKWAAFPDYILLLVKDIVEERWSTKHLAGEKFYYTYSMSDQIVKPLGYEALFDVAICQQCPFGAYHAGDYNRAYCLRPAHYAELTEQAKQAQRERLAAAETTAATAGGKALVHLQDIGFSNYKDLSIYRPPAGCTADCPCRSQGIDGAGMVQAICTNPAHYDGLRSAQTRAENKVKREQVACKVAAVLTHVTGLETIESRELALLVAAAVSSAGEKAIHAAAERHVPGLLPAKSKPSADDWARLAPLDMVRVAVDALLSFELQRSLEAEYYGTPQYAWYIPQLRQARKEHARG